MHESPKTETLKSVEKLIPEPNKLIRFEKGDSDKHE
jgi:hypothetical protein